MLVSDGLSHHSRIPACRVFAPAAPVDFARHSPIVDNPVELENESDEDHAIFQDIDAIGLDSDCDDLQDHVYWDDESDTDDDTDPPAQVVDVVIAKPAPPSGDGDSLSGDDGNEGSTSLMGSCHFESANVVHLYSDGLFNIDAVRDVSVKVADYLAIPSGGGSFGDLNDDHVWTSVRDRLHDGRSNGVLVTPPTSSFRAKADNCVPALRGLVGQDIYGLKDIPHCLKESLKSQDLAWLRVAEELSNLVSRHVPWCLVYEVIDVIEPTVFVGMKHLVDLPAVMQVEVRIHSMWLRVLWFGCAYTPRPYGQLEDLLDHLVSVLAVCALPTAREPPIRPVTDATAAWRGELVYRDKLKPLQESDDADLLVGGLRRSYTALRCLPRLVETGAEIGRALDQMLDEHPEFEKAVTEAVRARDEQQPNMTEAIQAAVAVIAVMVGCTDTRVGTEAGYPCEIRVGLLEAWRKYSGDPDDQIEEWLKYGAPMGIDKRPEPRGIFPVYTDAQAATSTADLLTEQPDFDDHTLAEEDQDALAELESMVARTWIRKFKSRHQAKRFVRGRLVTSKLFVITKTKKVKTKRGTWTDKVKKRLLLDLKASGISSASVKCERVVLPRILDTIFDALELLRVIRRRRRAGARLRYLILDFRHAFYHFPVWPGEQRYLTTRVSNLWYVWTRATQGSRGAPLISGRGLAQAMRLSTSVAPSSFVRSSTYVDDPIITLAGTESETDRTMAKVVLCLRALNYDLAFEKAQDSIHDPTITWTSARLHYSEDDESIEVSVKEEIIVEVTDDVNNALAGNRMRIRDLRKLAGRASCIASLLHVWRPFVSMLWGPIYNSRCHCSDSPGQLWTKGVLVPLTWIRAFLGGRRGTLTRRYSLSSYLGEGLDVEIVMDASGRGLGAYLKEDGVITEYFKDTLTDLDAEILGHELGTADGQQTWEALVALCALRLWSDKWMSRRIKLRVMSDSVTAMIMVLRLKARGSGPALVAREVALDLADALYQPNVVGHLPGIANTIADYLSRPDKWDAIALPAALADAREMQLPPRTRCWWRSLI